MKIIGMERSIFLEELAQEEAGDRRRPRIKNLVKNIRDWWNYCSEPTLAQRECEERINEIRTKYEYLRFRI